MQTVPPVNKLLVFATLVARWFHARIGEWITRGAGQVPSNGLCARGSRPPVYLPAIFALQAPLCGLVRTAAWCFPPAGLSSPAGICP